MSVRQYIGARYVTKIYENSLDPSSAEWEGGRAYEPLTLVTYLNSSYLSKKDVPASVGDPASNPTYWVITGAYNGQIATLQNQIDAINAEPVLRPRKIVMVTDSYGNYTNADGLNFIEKIVDTTGWDIVDIHRGGSGFSKAGVLNWKNMLIEFDAQIGDHADITDIMFIGGANDGPQSLTDIYNAIGDTVTYIKNNFPAVTITLAHVGMNFSESGFLDSESHSIPAYKMCGDFGARYMPNSEYVLMNTSFLNRADMVHPSQQGVNLLAAQIIQGIEHGSCDVMHFFIPTATSPKGTVSDMGNMKLINNVSTWTKRGGVLFTVTGSGTIASGDTVLALDNTVKGGGNNGYFIANLYIDGTYKCPCGIAVNDKDGNDQFPVKCYPFAGTQTFTTSFLIAGNGIQISGNYC